MEAVQNDQFQTDAFQRESFQCRFPMKIVSGKVSGDRVPRKGFQREGSQEGFPGGELPERCQIREFPKTATKFLDSRERVSVPFRCEPVKSNPSGSPHI